MSNNIYNILSNFNKVAQEPVTPATQTQSKAKTQLQESMDQVLSEKYMGFKKTVAAVKKSGADNPEAVAASIGRKKYGKEKFQKAAAAGKKLGEQADHVQSTATGFSAAAPQGKRLSVTLEPGKKLTPSDVKLKADKDSDEKKKDMSESEVEESGLQAYLGKKKYGEQGMKALQKAGREGASKEQMAKIRAKHDKMDEAAKPDYIDLDKDGNKTEPMKKAAKDAKSKKVQEVAPPGAKAERMVKHIKKGYAKDGKLTDVEKRKAYGAAWKAHNKGKVEEAIKAMMEAGFTKEQIVEGWDDMMKAIDNRRHNMKTGEKRQGAKGEIEKTSTGIKHTRRYDKKTGETETGSDGQQVKRGRGRPKKHAFESALKDPTTINKMIVETFRDIIEGSIQGGVWTSDPPKKGRPNVPPPQDIDGGSVTPAPKPSARPAPVKPKTSATPSTPEPWQNPRPGEAMGSIKGGVWTSDPPKPGEKGVPVPIPVDEADKIELTSLAGRAAGLTAGLMSMAPRAVYGVATGDTSQTKIEPKTANGVVNAFKQGWSDTNPFNTIGDIKKAIDNKEVAKEDDMEEGNYFSGQLAKARAAGKTHADLDGDGDMEKVREAEEKADESKCMECGMLESKCKCDDKVSESLNLFRRLAGLQECGMSPIAGYSQDMQDSQGKMNISTNMSSDGNKSVTITADGNSATELMQMLKLAGMGGHEHSHSDMQSEPEGEPEGIMVVAHGEEEVEEAKDERYHASTTPDEHVMPVQAQTKGGDGDVAGKEKKMTPNGYQFGDNPQAMKESMSLKLIKEYEAIKVKK